MPEPHRAPVVRVTVDGRPLPAEHHRTLSCVRVEESVHLPTAFELRFDDPHFALLDTGDLDVGARVELAFPGETGHTTVAAGEVTAVAVEPGRGGRHDLVVTGLDVAHRLQRGTRTRAFQQATDADLARQIADEHGLDADVDGTTEVHDHVLQHHESDWAFLRGRAARLGFATWVTGSTLHFRRRPDAPDRPPALRWGGNLHRFRVRYSATEACDDVTLHGWDPVDKQRLLGRAEGAELGTDAPFAGELHRRATSTFGAPGRSVRTVPVASRDEADAVAGALLARAGGDELLVRGEAAGHPLLAAGAEVRVEGVGRRLSGAYRLTAVEHVHAAGAPYRTGFTSGGAHPADPLAAAAGVDPGLGRLLGVAAAGGLAHAVVTDVDDPERLGRVRVEYADLGAESGWAPVAAPGAGDERGLQALPSVGDAVVVGFERGDARRPVVLGGLWSRADAPPATDRPVDGAQPLTVWRSRRGHRVELRDEGEAGVTVVVGDDRSRLHLTSAGITMRAPRIELAADGEVVVSGATIRLN